MLPPEWGGRAAGAVNGDRITRLPAARPSGRFQCANLPPFGRNRDIVSRVAAAIDARLSEKRRQVGGIRFESLHFSA
ncbi:protein of unknown function [Burkholderia multivorans]